MTETHHFTFALVDDFTHLSFACAVDPLRIANLVSGQTLYHWSYASLDGVSATSSDGTEIRVHHAFDELPDCDHLFVLSGIHMRMKDHRQLISALRRARAKGSVLGALCSGAYVLAKAGLLNGKKAAIHWEYHDSFMEEFPEVNLVGNVFVADETHITASGGTATADLMLHLIARDHGEELALAVADQMVFSSLRSGTAAQRLSLQSRNGIRNRHLLDAIAIMVKKIDDPVSSANIAGQIGISTRQVERLFGKYLNTSPKKYFLELRMERARHLLSQADFPVSEVAIACGFTNFSHFSRAYRLMFGESPATTKASPLRM